MRDTRSGKRTAVEAVGSRFAEAAAITRGEETTTGSPGYEDAKDSVPLVAVLETELRKLQWKKEPLLSCCWFAQLS